MNHQLLHPGLQRWMGKRGWRGLRPIQEQSVPPLLAGDDALVTAPTAGGKTEAVFLPLLTSLASADFGCILAVSPLKALINDQHRRISEIVQHLDGIVCHRWHGDVGAAERQRFVKSSRSVLIITPESLEAGFVRRSPLVDTVAAKLSAIVVDELHAFIGTERGLHLRSLLSRIEARCPRGSVQRVGLSATIGDPDLAMRFLQGDQTRPCRVISHGASGARLRLQLRGVEADPENPSETLRDVSDHLYRVMRGSSNLVFANSRSRVEELSDLLAQRSEAEGVPREFFPHHGNLSRDLRHSVEERFRSNRPTTAICTSTMELGVDIGTVATVGQVGCPHSVASLRQRLGRSGRTEGSAPTLRMYVLVPARGERSALVDDLRMELVQGIAMIELILDAWIEPGEEGLHLSTLVHQTLSLLTEVGAASAGALWSKLCANGAFSHVDQPLYSKVLRDLGAADVIYQLDDGLLTLTDAGDSITNSHEFYAAFESPEEFRVEHNGVVLGTLPVGGALTEGTTIVFAGRRWRIEHADPAAKVISVQPSRFGRAPMFMGGGGSIAREVHEKMFRVYLGSDEPRYLDAGARELLADGRAEFRRRGLETKRLVGSDDGAYLLPWAGDRAHETLVLWLLQRGIKASREGVTIRCDAIDAVSLASVAHEIRTDPPPDPLDLAAMVQNAGDGKFHHLLALETRLEEYAADRIDIPGAQRALAEFE